MIPGAPHRAPLWLLSLPASVAVLVFVGVPIGNLVLASVSGTGAGTGGFARQYVRFLGDPYYLGVLADTIRISVISTFITFALAYPACLFLYLSNSRLRTLVIVLALSPLFVSVAVRSYSWLVILGPVGVLGGLNLLYSDAAVVIGLVHVLLPYMVLSMTAALASVDRVYIAAAQSLGSGLLGVTFKILMPLSLPGILAGAVISFTIAMSAFVIQMLLGGARFKTMINLISQQMLQLADWEFGSAISVILLVVTAAAVVLALRFGRETAPLLS